jgi:hypothetical protein
LRQMKTPATNRQRCTEDQRPGERRASLSSVFDEGNNLLIAGVDNGNPVIDYNIATIAKLGNTRRNFCGECFNLNITRKRRADFEITDLQGRFRLANLFNDEMPVLGRKSQLGCALA